MPEDAENAYMDNVQKIIDSDLEFLLLLHALWNLGPAVGTTTQDSQFRICFSGLCLTNMSLTPAEHQNQA